jgi:tRNA/tmRNA/rRNA uracil-C5-methylase (TrmA/RlmC/RlmD family)
MSREVLPQVSDRGFARLKPGDEIVVVAAELVAGGAALARFDGLPVFIPALYPGDEALVRVTEVKRGFARAEVMQLRRHSELRRLEPCPVAAECGGCDWTSLRLDHQLAAKLRILSESLRRVGKIDLDTVPPIAIHASPLNYRIKSRLHVQDGHLGFFAFRSHRVVPLPNECEVVGPQVIAHLPTLRAQAARIREGVIQTLETPGAFLTDTNQIERIDVRGFRYAVSAATFFQGNRHLLGTLIDLVLEQARQCQRRRIALDLFCGVGFFTLPLAMLFEQVLGVEAADESYRLAVHNGASFPNVEFAHSSVEEFLSRRAPPAVDFLLLDPPRAGVSLRALHSASDSTADILCYLSCDPVTFSRDAFRLVRRGWRLSSLHLVDLFPNTHHVETFASFQREGSGSA